MRPQKLFPIILRPYVTSLILILCITTPLICQTDSNNPELSQIEGTWEIDLRQSPNSDPYLKQFIIEPIDRSNFSGAFYDSPIQEGFLNTVWPNIHFAFTTKDRKNSYYHSGYLKGDTIYGITYCPKRTFAMPWKGVQKVEHTVAHPYTKIDSLLTVLESQQKFNGIALIGDKDSVLFSQSYGYAELDSHQPIDMNTQFYIASLSKQFTATAILLLEQDGLLKLDQNVKEFIENFPYPEVKIHHLLSNTSGISGYIDYFTAHWNKSKQANTDDVIELLSSVKPSLAFSPGSKMEYSNTNYVLLAKIIELTSKKSYAHFLENRIFKPCGMERTYASCKPYFNGMDSNIALGYVTENDRRIKAELSSTEYMDRVNYLSGIEGDGSVVTSILDLFNWHKALCSDHILTQASKEKMFAPYRLRDNSESTYGYGWYTDGAIIEHTGSWPGYQTRIIRNLKTGVVGITFKNIETNYWNWIPAFDTLIK